MPVPASATSAARSRLPSATTRLLDDPVVGDMVIRASVTAERRRALVDAPRILRLTEPLQRLAWTVLVPLALAQLALTAVGVVIVG